MTFSFSDEVKPDGNVSSLNTAIREAIDAVSMCWFHENGARIFDDQQANEIANTLSWFVLEWGATYVTMDKPDSYDVPEQESAKQSQPSIDDQGLKLEILKTIGYPSLEVLNAAYRWVKGDN